MCKKLPNFDDNRDKLLVQKKVQERTKGNDIDPKTLMQVRSTLKKMVPNEHGVVEKTD